MRVTVRLDDEQADHVDAMRQDPDASDAEAVRNCIDRSIELADIEQRRDDEVADLEAELAELREELQAERSRADRLAGKLDAKNETIRAKESHIDSLESTVYDQGQALRDRRGLLGTVRRALGSGRDDSVPDDADEDR
jgi:peptidoglycan hydrolase CwlO-like protein